MLASQHLALTSTRGWPPFRLGVLTKLVKTENASAPWTFLEQCDTLRAITAGRSARSARLFIGSMLGEGGRLAVPGTLMVNDLFVQRFAD